MRVELWFVVCMLLTIKVSRAFLRQRIHIRSPYSVSSRSFRRSSHSMTLEPSASSLSVQQILVCSQAYRRSPEMKEFLKKDKFSTALVISKEESLFSPCPFDCLWTAHRGSVEVDACLLELMFLGSKQLPAEETASKWEKTVEERLSSVKFDRNIGPGGRFQSELNAAYFAVHKASFISRSLQKSLLKGEGSMSKKEDRSPVTMADFAVQVLVIQHLIKAFPTDKFIAEESSAQLRDDAELRQGVQQVLEQSTGESWPTDRIYNVLDNGVFEGVSERVWVLDPIDGTKGFMRGEHFCIALALLVNGVPTLSVLGCPNLSLNRVLEGTSGNDIAVVEKPLEHTVLPSSAYNIYPPSSGSIYFAVTGEGAYARSLSMDTGAAVPVEVSPSSVAPSDVLLCESAEAAHGNRGVTSHLASMLNMKRPFLRLDGQCKYCAVGAGAAQGNVRLPPLGYREKIWDHAPGAHFVTEAGGRVSDISGKPLDFAQGVLLPASVTGIVASNGALHDTFLESLHRAYKEGVESGEVQPRVFLD